ncbi:rho guanine nucleotide exchange factor 12 isoform X2 [Lepisosteus oculatus]|uniref:rho guanine nucleotide exchange factor 12 isoform X2 n=1 Tax=Lepisosteus oculatus TaxID=7918 RepID=UPI0037129E85
MSGTQSTITDRFPTKKPTRQCSIHSKDPPPDKKHKIEKSSVSSHEFDPTDLVSRTSRSRVDGGKPELCGLVQRCVIIQRDDNGFGLTVSGDNPVFVQLVKEDGAAMRAGVQTGDRIIKVNGTLVTHSNHVEVVKLIKSGSYVALTVLGRPPGLPQIPLTEVEGDAGPLGHGGSSVTSPHSPGQTAGEHTSSPSDRITAPVPVWEENNIVHNQKVDILQKMLSKEQQDLQAMKEEYSRNPTPKLLKEIQEAKKHIPQLQVQLNKATGGVQDGPLPSRLPSDALQISEGEDGAADADQGLSPRGDGAVDSPRPNSTAPSISSGLHSALTDSQCQRDTPCHSPKTAPREGLNSFESPEAEDTPDPDSHSQSSIGSPSSRLASQIIGAEDDYFETEDQINGQCSCFQSMELLKSRPAHLAAFLHHVVSQFDPAPLLCYLYADLYKQTNSKETRRIFMDFHTFFMDRGANLKVAVPESISTELERRRPELIPEDLHRQYIQVMQDTLLPDIQKNLEDFRQKRSMGLTVAENDLTKLDTERMRDRVALEKERTCAEHIISKIEDVLLTSQPTEEEKCTTMQYVILSYMKHLGVKVKEPRILEQKRVRIGAFLPKIKKSIRTEKEGEEKVKKPRFPSILGPPRRPSRQDSMAIGRAMELHGKRLQKQMSQPAPSVPEHPEAGRTRGSQSSEGSDPTHTPSLATSPPHSASGGLSAEPGGRDFDSGAAPFSAAPKHGEGQHPGDSVDGLPRTPNTVFDFNIPGFEQLPEEEREVDRTLEVGTPKAIRRMDTLSGGEVQSEDDQCYEIDAELDPPNWQQLVSREVLAGLTPHEIKRQEVINELFYTERAHLRMLRVLDRVFYQKLSQEAILSLGEIKQIFANLEEILQLHVSISEQMVTIRKKNETSVIDQIGDDLLSWFSGGEEEKIKRAVGTFCSNQPFALELIKTKKKDSRFTAFMQEAESNRLCRRLQLKDIIPVEMQRLTKYPLLLENIAKNTEDAEEREKVKRAGECCRQILNYVNQAVKESENKQRLEDYQRRLDLSSLKQSEYPMISEFKNLDLTKRKMIHEGPLSWKVNKDKTIELYTLLLEDILVLLQKQDERLILKCHSKNLAGTADTKHIFSPIIKLNTVLVRSVATDNKSFFVLSMSDNGAQIYELMAQTVSEQKTWQYLITQRADSMKTKPHNVIPLPQPDERDDADLISTTAHHKLSKDSDHISTASVQSPEKDVGVASPGMLQTPPSDSAPFEGLKSDEEEEEAGQEEEEGPYLDPELDDRLPFLPQRSRQGVAVDDEELAAFHFPPSPARAEEALKSLAALKQALLSQLLLEGERGPPDAPQGRPCSGRLLRTTSLRGPVAAGRSPDSSAGEPSAGGAGPAGGPRQSREGEAGRESASGEAAEGAFEPSENYAHRYLVLEGDEGAGESSTDDGLLGGPGELGERRGSAGDAGIDLRKLLSPSSLPASAPDFGRQVMTHIRVLQASLHHLKEVETKYNLLCQRLAGSASDTDEHKDKS